MNLSWIDWVIVAAFLGAAIASVWWTKRYMRSVADFLVGSRCAGRYLLTITGVGMFGAIGTVAGWEAGYRVGYGAGWWNGFSAPVGLILVMSGWVIYRFRQTRALTLAQFFEVRYSRGFRVYAGLLAWFSGVVNYGIFPSIAARFFIYFAGIPEYTVHLGSYELSLTYALVLLFLTVVSLWITLSGGQISIMVCDFVLGTLFLAAGIFLSVYCVRTIHWTQIGQAFQSIPNTDTNSMVNPFKTSEVRDFNIWYYLIGIFGSVYNCMAWQGNSGFNAAPKSPHEARMAGIVGIWRWGTIGASIGFLSICAFTVMHHPDFAPVAERAHAAISAISNPAIQDQMTVPIVLAKLMPVGLAGLLLAVLITGAVTTDDTYLHSWGSIFIQDVVMPFRKKPYTPQEHVRALRWSIFSVAVFAYFFSLLFRQTDYILMFFALTGAVFCGGAGSAIVGGLYWKRGTTAGAWCALTVGLVMALSGGIIQQVPFHTMTMQIRAPEAQAVTVNDKAAQKVGDVWVCPYEFWRQEEWKSARIVVTTATGTSTSLVRYAFGAALPRRAADDAGKGVLIEGVAIHPADLTLVPLPKGSLRRAYIAIRSVNSQWTLFGAMMLAVLSYVVVSLLGRRVFDLDRMLHRGKYAIQSDVAVGDQPELPRKGWRALIGITPEFTRGDRIVYYASLFWSLGWIALFFIQLAINMVKVQSDQWWLNFFMYGFFINLAVGFVTTFWIGAGGIRDLVSLFKTLGTLKRNDADDGRVVDHHNVGEQGLK